MGRLIKNPLLKATALEQYLHGNGWNNCGYAVAWGSLLRQSWSTTSLPTTRAQSCFILKMEAVYPFETSGYTTGTRGHILENSVLHCYGRENIKKKFIRTQEDFFLRYFERLGGLVFRVSWCRQWGPGFDFRRYQIFLSSSKSVKVSTGPREDKWGATLKKN
jgi:hypothetical protein